MFLALVSGLACNTLQDRSQSRRWWSRRTVAVTKGDRRVEFVAQFFTVEEMPVRGKIGI